MCGSHRRMRRSDDGGELLKTLDLARDPRTATLTVSELQPCYVTDFNHVIIFPQ